jgi:hypothetical protein
MLRLVPESALPRFPIRAFAMMGGRYPHFLA